ncbi:SIR2-domain-containing protein [Lactarius deliciosus]|nr:SIR2-domain-containing protein [Lactarius deliciosus]
MADNSTPQNPRSSSLRYPSRLSPKQRRAVYEGQVRAFLEASEIVEIEEEVLDDILDGFGGFGEASDNSHDTAAGENIPVPVRNFGRDIDAAGNIELPANGPSLDETTDKWDACSPQAAREAFSTQVWIWTKADYAHTGLSSFMKEYVITRAIPIPELLCAFDIYLCEELQRKKSATLVYFLQVVLSGELQLRERLSQYGTLQDAVNLITSSRRILVLTGAGISVSCGIPDFRSRNGLYATLKEKEEYDLDDPQQMLFDISYFKENPSVFYSFARQIYPSNFTPSPCHRFLKLIEDNGKVRNYTQNIDTLETAVGIRNVLQCHGSFATASCLECRIRVPGNVIEREIMQGEVPLCEGCSGSGKNWRKARHNRRKPSKQSNSEDEDEPLFPPWIMKPDITFFGEKLTDSFEECLVKDRDQVDLVLIIGTSLKVAPVSDIITHMPHSVPQILINKTPVTHINPDIILLGDADSIIEHLCEMLGWSLPLAKAGQYLGGKSPLSMKRRSQERMGGIPKRVADSHIWLFEGAEGGKWLLDFEAARLRAAQPSDPSQSDLSSSSVSMTPVDPPRDGKRARLL